MMRKHERLAEAERLGIPIMEKHPAGREGEVSAQGKASPT